MVPDSAHCHEEGHDELASLVLATCGRLPATFTSNDTPLASSPPVESCRSPRCTHEPLHGSAGDDTRHCYTSAPDTAGKAQGTARTKASRSCPPIAEAKDLIVAPHRIPDLHRDLAPTQGLSLEADGRSPVTPPPE
jgi:hypothetical protein